MVSGAQSASMVLAGPVTGSPATPAWRQLTPPDIGLAEIGPGAGFAANRWYTSQWMTPGSTVAPSAARALIAIPIWISKANWTPADLGFDITTSQTGAFNIHLGIYYDSGGTPGNLLYDAGLYNVAANASGATSYGLGNLPSPPTNNPSGLYWLTMLTDKTTVPTAVLRASSTSGSYWNTPLGALTPGVSSNDFYIAAYATSPPAMGPLPSTFGSGTTLQNNGTATPMIFIKF
jgi:hypothetical protein